MAKTSDNKDEQSQENLDDETIFSNRTLFRDLLSSELCEFVLVFLGLFMFYSQIHFIHKNISISNNSA